MSEFNIIQITDDLLYELSGMLPEDVTAAIRKGLPVTAMAALKDDIAVGTLCGAVDGDFFEIESIFVAPEYRRQGAGTALMKELFDLLEEDNIPLRAEYRPDPEQKSEFDDALEAFFISLGLSEVEDNNPPYITEHLKNFTAGGDGGRISREGILPFSKGDAEMLESIAAGSEQNDYEWSVTSDTVDKDLSLCRVKNDAVVSYAAVDTAVGEPIEISAVWFEEEDIDDMREMLSKVIYDLQGKYHPDSEVVMLAMGPGAEGVVKSFCPGAGTTCKCFVRNDYEEL